MTSPIADSVLGKQRRATIMHVDMDAFFASVEVLVDPTLKGKPVIVGGDGSRGVVASCSYEARFYGVRSAMPSMRAKRLCPHAVFVHGRYDLYEKYSKQMLEVFASFTPLVEALSLDEAFLDVAGAQKLFGTPGEIGAAIRQRLKDNLGLTASVGVATTKHVAKLASVAAKPRATKAGAIEGTGVVVVEGERALAFLHPMPVRAMWGVGPKTAEKLERYGISTIGDIARSSVDQLVMTLGEATGRHVHDLAWNRDDRRVVPSRGVKSVGHEQTYAKDLKITSDLHHQFVRLADAVARRLRTAELAGRTVTVKVRFGDFRTITRSRTLTTATANAGVLVRLADELTSTVDAREGVRLLGISVSNLEAAISVEQLMMGDEPADDTHDDIVLDDVVDRIRERYGDSAVVPAPLVGSGRPDVMRKGAQQWGPSNGSPPKTGGPSNGSPPKTGGPSNGSPPKTGGPSNGSPPKTGGPSNGSPPKTAGRAEDEESVDD